jgi:hypothetical protein
MRIAITGGREHRPTRTIAWWSAGAASATAARLALDADPETIVAYCDTSASEHPDNLRFLADCERWYGREILRLRSEEYADIFDVFDRTGWLVGPKGARCTTELKKKVRQAFSAADDRCVLGYTADEEARIKQFRGENPEIDLWPLLFERGITKQQCLNTVATAGIELPEMYRLGYKNNNCIGCVKGQAGYWNKIRIDFPEHFARMAEQERKMNVAICKTEPVVDGKRTRVRVFLDELPPGQGRYESELETDCGLFCSSGSGEAP